MLPLLDTQVRFVLLNHVAVRLADAGPREVSAAGLADEQLATLRRLSAADLNRLASMRSLTIGVALDGEALGPVLQDAVESTLAHWQDVQCHPN